MVATAGIAISAKAAHINGQSGDHVDQAEPCAPARAGEIPLHRLRRSPGGGLRFPVDSPLEGDGFELTVLPRRTPLGRAMWFPSTAPPARRGTDPERDNVLKVQQ